MHSLPELVLVTSDPALAARVRSVVSPVTDVTVFDGASAATGLHNASFDVALIDARLPGRLASVLLRLFLFHNTAGHVALLGRASSTSTIIRLSHRDARVEVFFDPLDLEELRRWTYAAVETSVAETMARAINDG